MSDDKLRELAGDMSAVADYIDVIQPLKDRFGVPRNIIRAWAERLNADISPASSLLEKLARQIMESCEGGLTVAYNLEPQWPPEATEEFKQGFLAGISSYRTAIKQLRDYREQVVATNQELRRTLEANDKWLKPRTSKRTGDD
jgi:hypothetical protein